MNDPGAVCVAEGRCHLKEYRTNDRNRQGAGLLDYLFQRSAADVPHHKEVQSLSLPHRMHRHDVGMIQIRDGNGFPPKPLGHAFIHQEAG
jgi:hypothetical protein